MSPIRRANNKNCRGGVTPGRQKGSLSAPRPAHNKLRGQPQVNERNGPVVASERHEQSTLAHRSPTTGAWSLFVGSTPPAASPSFPISGLQIVLGSVPTKQLGQQRAADEPDQPHHCRGDESNDPENRCALRPASEEVPDRKDHNQAGDNRCQPVKNAAHCQFAFVH